MRKVIPAILAVMASCWACGSRPDMVLSPDAMASLLADIYTAESVVEVNRTTFADDSMRKALKQSIYLAHGVTPEQVDSSYMWYGKHLDQYIEIHDKVAELLQRRIEESAAGAISAVGEAGDSVDTWGKARQYLINSRSPSRVIRFSLDKDENWVKGDQYSWALKALNSRRSARWAIAVEYSDGTVEYTQNQLQGEGWSRLTLLTDSTRSAQRVYGYVALSPLPGEDIFIDSIELVRKRLDPFVYAQRYRQRRIGGPRQDSEPILTPPAPDLERQAPLDAPENAQPRHGLIKRHAAPN